jgi:hypothetical protein
LCTNPVRIVAFNTVEGWSRDVTKDIADVVRRRLVERDEVLAALQEFVETAVERVDTGEEALAIERNLPRPATSAFERITVAVGGKLSPPCPSNATSARRRPQT